MKNEPQGRESHENQEAAFLYNERGEVCIAFADPAYVRSETILADERDLSLHAVLHESSHLIGQVSEGMFAAFTGRKEALLAAVRSDGSIFELMAPIERNGAGKH